MRPYSPGGVLIALAAALQGSIPATPSTHRLRLGLPGYLILFAPPAFVPQRQLPSRKPPSPLVFLPISTHFTATPGIPPPSPALKPASFPWPSPVKPGPFTQDLKAAYAPFTPSNSGQRLPPTYYRGCWHVVSRGFLLGYRHLHSSPQGQRFTIRRPSSLTRRRCIRLSPIAQDSLLLPPVGVWAVSQSQCGRHPLRPATHRRLGGPLPHQLANRTRAHPIVVTLSSWNHATP